MTTEEKLKKTIDVVFAVSYCTAGLIAITLALFAIWNNLTKEPDVVIERVDYPPIVLIESPKTEMVIELAEDPELQNEAELSAEAIYETIGTDAELEAFGYDFSYLCRIVFEEAGGDGEHLIRAVATAALNECIAEGNRINPVEATSVYQWTSDQGRCSQEVIDICFDVLISGNLCECIQHSTMFYSPNALGGTSDDHEKQNYITTIAGVRFFEEIK